MSEKAKKRESMIEPATRSRRGGVARVNSRASKIEPAVPYSDDSGWRPAKSGLPANAPTGYRDQYAYAVTDAFRRPVISPRAAAEYLARGQSPQVIQEVESGLRGHYPNGMLSMQNLSRELVIADMYRRDDGMPQEFKDIVAEKQRTFPLTTRNDAAIMSVLSGDDPNEDTPQFKVAGQLRYLVAQHTPNEKYAQFGARTQKEQDALQGQYGDNANYIMSNGQRENHEALRVTELLSAADKNYEPASGFSQAARYVGGLFGPAVDAVRSVTTEPGVYDPRRTGEAWDEASLISKPDGKYAYAAERWQRGEDERGSIKDLDAYTAEGRAKYGAYDPTTIRGVANATQMNTSFPLAQAYTALAPVRELPMHIGTAIGGDDPLHLAAGLNAMRQGGNRITPVIPEGMESGQFEDQTRALQQADTGMDGWNSAYFGPKSADAWNATMGSVLPKAQRTYLSPFANTVLGVPGESLSDPMNLVANLTTGPLAGVTYGAYKGGVSGAGQHLIRGLVKMGTRSLDDAIEETAEDAALIGPTTTGPKDFFAPERDNLMMGEKDPNDPDYDQQFQRRTQEALDARRSAADAYQQSRPKPGPGAPISGPRYGARNPL